jgi:hypothetical protein
VRVLDVQQKADVGQALFPVAVIGVVHHQDLQRRQFGHARRGHAALHPAGEGVVGDDQPVFEF